MNAGRRAKFRGRRLPPAATRNQRFSRRGLFATIALAAATLGAGLLLGVWRPAHITPGLAAGSNVLLITIDTLRADRVGAYGNRSGLTPTLDQLAARGVRFEAAYTPVPMTLPAHASILTGLEPPSHGIRNNTAFKLGRTPTLATMLKGAGYRTGAFVGALVLSARFGLNRDFDVYDDRIGGDVDPAGARLAERRADEVIQPATEWILRATSRVPANAATTDAPGQNRPWFAWIHLYDPHSPYRAPAEYGHG
ncbi:MAG TPA: sulfatase-like hydrolase/transferase, partial [Vicinamibacterales bacterium]